MVYTVKIKEHNEYYFKFIINVGSDLTASFFERGEVAVFHWDHWTSVSGTYSYTHVSTLVIIDFMKFESLYTRISKYTSTRWSIWSAVNSSGTNLADTHFIPKLSVKIEQVQVLICQHQKLLPWRSIVDRFSFTRAILHRLCVMTKLAHDVDHLRWRFDLFWNVTQQTLPSKSNTLSSQKSP